MNHFRQALLAFGATAVLVVILYAVFGVGGSLRPLPLGPPPQVVHVPR
jgi:hypothetical protein